MWAVALACVSLSHTPGHYLDNCNTEPIVLDHVNVSQVHYMRLKPTCNYTFAPETCQWQTLSMHRFEPDIQDGFIVVSHGNASVQRHDEHMQNKSGEPFTQTPYVTTVELNDVDAGDTGCLITMGADSEGVGILVLGKAEDWWLAFTIPYQSYHIRHAWAYGNMSDVVAQFPFIIYGVFTFLLAVVVTDQAQSKGLMYLLILFSFVVDFAWPSVQTSLTLESDSDMWSTMWTVLFVLRVGLYLDLVSIVYLLDREENVEPEVRDWWTWMGRLLTAPWRYLRKQCQGNPKYAKVAQDERQSAPAAKPQAKKTTWFRCITWNLLLVVGYLFHVATGIGGYVLLPIVIARYRLWIPAPDPEKAQRLVVLVVYIAYAVVIAVALDGHLPLRTVLIVCLAIHFAGLSGALFTDNYEAYPDELGKAKKLIILLDIAQGCLLVAIVFSGNDDLLHVTAAVALAGIVGCIYKVWVLNRSLPGKDV